ncbi:MAG: hypothetical protein HUU35_13770 [Armatimonadetes bacterium]|nr:hypothetical protein [Armatimonadota bacterium]
MRPWIVALWLAGAATAQVPFSPAGTTAEIMSQSMDVRFDGQEVDLVGVWQVRSTADSIGMVFSLPQSGLDFTPPSPDYLGEFRQLGNRVDWHSRIIFSTSSLVYWGIPRHSPRPVAYLDRTPDDEATVQTAIYPPQRIADGSLEAALATHGADLPPPLRAWCQRELKQGRELTLQVKKMKSGRGRPRTVTFQHFTRYNSPEGYLPFGDGSQGPEPDAARTDRPFRLAVLGPGRLQPTYPDGYPILPPAALLCAYRLTAEARARVPLARPEHRYFCLYEANVPRTARTAAMRLQEVANPGPDIPPTRPIRRERWRVIPLDLIALAVLLGILVSSVVRRTRGKSSSAV